MALDAYINSLILIVDWIKSSECEEIEGRIW